MCLNQIFKNEQLAIMRYALAPSGPDAVESLRVLRQSRLDFQAFPYPHRPYVPAPATARNPRSHASQGTD